MVNTAGARNKRPRGGILTVLPLQPYPPHKVNPMTPQEKELLMRFLQQLTEASAGQKDADAETLIRDACARQPDALYLLVQRALQLDQAFQATQAQAQKLQAELDQARISSPPSVAAGGGGFLSDPNAWGSQPRAPAARAAVPQHAAAPAPVTRPSPWGGAGMLGAVATTAAGVVAGSFLFQGIQGLMNKDASSASAKADPAAAPDPVAHAHEELEEPADAYAAGSDDADGDFA